MPHQYTARVKALYGGVPIEVSGRFGCRDVFIATFNESLEANLQHHHLAAASLATLRQLWDAHGARRVWAVALRGKLTGDFSLISEAEAGTPLGTSFAAFYEWLAPKIKQRYTRIDTKLAEEVTGFRRRAMAITFSGNQDAFMAHWWATLVYRAWAVEGHDFLRYDGIAAYLDRVPETRESVWDGNKQEHLDLWGARTEPQAWRIVFSNVGPITLRQHRKGYSNLIKTVEKGLAEAASQGRISLPKTAQRDWL